MTVRDRNSCSSSSSTGSCEQQQAATEAKRSAGAGELGVGSWELGAWKRPSVLEGGEQGRTNSRAPRCCPCSKLAFCRQICCKFASFSSNVGTCICERCCFCEANAYPYFSLRLGGRLRWDRRPWRPWLACPYNPPFRSDSLPHFIRRARENNHCNPSQKRREAIRESERMPVQLRHYENTLHR